MTTKEMLAFKYVEDVAKSHKDAAFSAFCAGYSVSERENTELKKLVKLMKGSFQKLLKIKRTVDLNLFDVESVHRIARAALEATKGGKKE